MTIRRLGARLVYSKRFADHHAFTLDELAGVAREAGRRRATLVMTTQKDAARIPEGGWPEGAPPLCVLRAEFAFRDRERDFWKAVNAAIERFGENALPDEAAAPDKAASLDKTPPSDEAAPK
jgi:tetraacyldisaccharide 4'-kinase